MNGASTALLIAIVAAAAPTPARACSFAIPSPQRLVTHSVPAESKAILPYLSDVLDFTDCHCQGKLPAEFLNHIPTLENHIPPAGSAAMP